LFLGPGVGAWFYEIGGFMLPFLVVGAVSTALSMALVVTVPNLNEPSSSPEEEGLVNDANQVQLR